MQGLWKDFAYIEERASTPWRRPDTIQEPRWTVEGFDSLMVIGTCLEVLEQASRSPGRYYVRDVQVGRSRGRTTVTKRQPNERRCVERLMYPSQPRQTFGDARGPFYFLSQSPASQRAEAI